MKILITTLPFLIGICTLVAEEPADPFAVIEPNERDATPEIVPSTLAEAHEQLEKQLPADELKKIDAMTSEDKMIEFHFGLGMGLRNGWGLWGDSPLAKHMRSLGFTHPDDMSSVILETFWCKRHGKEFRIKERVEYYRAYWAENESSNEEKAEQPQKDKANKSEMATPRKPSD